MKSPFKFLDSFTKEDKNIFFGRDNETEELYQKVFESKVLLVYGVSGTGKSSLIQCGLANKFEESDWLPISIRRGANINESLFKGIKNYELGVKNEQKRPSVKKLLKNIYLDHFKPIYLIFDQFEELFIFGSKTEQEEFIQSVKKITESDLNCKFLFVIREEYLASITAFEKHLPEIMHNRIRIEKMNRTNAVQTIEGPCKYANIEVEDGFSESLLEKLSPNSIEVELTYLQVYLDKIFRTVATNESSLRGGTTKQSDFKEEIATPSSVGFAMTFNKDILTQLGNVKDLLGSFLDEQITELESPDEGLIILKAFVSTKGTKRQITEEEVLEYARTLGKNIEIEQLKNLIQKFIALRILRDKDENNRYELRHDALAAKIYEKITLVEKELLEIRQFIEHAFDNYKRRKVLLSKADLSYLAPYEDKIYLGNELQEFINKSKREVEKAKRRKRFIVSAATIILITVFAGFTWWALNERTKAFEKEKEANELYIKSQANNYNFIAKEVLAKDPTKALRIAEYAYSLDTTNKAIYQNMVNIYYNNAICRKVFKGHGDRVSSVSFSPDGQSILTGSRDKTARLWDLDGNLLQVFKGHEDWINSVSFSPDGQSILTGSRDKTARLWDLDGNLLQVFKGHEDWINSVSFSPDGQSILTGSRDKTSRLWDLDGNLLQVFKGHESVISSVSYSPDGESILTSSYDKTARLWDLDGNLLQVFKGHERWISSVSFSPDGQSILTGSLDKTARLWQIKTPYSEFKEKGEYLELSVKDKLKYEIINYEDVIKYTKPKDMFDAADYYLDQNNEQTDIKLRREYLNKAEKLFEKLFNVSDKTEYLLKYQFLLLLQYIEKPNEKYIQKTNAIHKRILKVNNLEELQKIVSRYKFFISNDAMFGDIEEFNYFDKEMEILKKLISHSVITDETKNGISSSLSNGSYQYIEDGKFEQAKQLALLAKQANLNNTILYKNLALAYLLTDEWEKAKEVYVTWQDSTYLMQNQEFLMKDTFLDDIKDLESKGITHPNFAKVRELLKEEKTENIE